MPADFEKIVTSFDIPGDFLQAEPHGEGHINATFVTLHRHNGRLTRHLIQRINNQIFVDPFQLMDNIGRVTEHIRTKLQQQDIPDVSSVTMTVIPTVQGRSCLHHSDGSYWRALTFIPDTICHQTVQNPQQALNAAHAFGRFQTLLVDLPGPRLAETIPAFHDTPRRLADYERILSHANPERIAAAREEISEAAKLSHLAATLIHLQKESVIPERITHNDTKLNNVLFDASEKAICVVDLDTVMPGLSLYDFADMVRTMTTTANEDERDLSLVRVQPALFEAVVHGYLKATIAMLTDAEKQHLLSAAETIIYEQALRFLTDHLAGDRYYRIARPGHNLDRCRTQLALLQSIAYQRETLSEIISRSLTCSD